MFFFFLNNRWPARIYSIQLEEVHRGACVFEFQWQVPAAKVGLTLPSIGPLVGCRLSTSPGGCQALPVMAPLHLPPAFCSYARAGTNRHKHEHNHNRNHNRNHTSEIIRQGVKY